jgi:hypothetical protein
MSTSPNILLTHALEYRENQRNIIQDLVTTSTLLSTLVLNDQELLSNEQTNNRSGSGLRLGGFST